MKPSKLVEVEGKELGRKMASSQRSGKLTPKQTTSRPRDDKGVSWAFFQGRIDPFLPVRHMLYLVEEKGERTVFILFGQFADLFQQCLAIRGAGCRDPGSGTAGIHGRWRRDNLPEYEHEQQ